jgi:hypothetical protein
MGMFRLAGPLMAAAIVAVLVLAGLRWLGAV